MKHIEFWFWVQWFALGAAFVLAPMALIFADTPASEVSVPIQLIDDELPTAYIEVTINGVPAKLGLVSNGLTLNLTGSFVSRADLRTVSKTREGLGTADFVPYARLGLTDTFELPGVVAAAVPDPLAEKLGLDGTIDPYLFDEFGCAKVDLAARQLHFASGPTRGRCTYGLARSDVVLPRGRGFVASIDGGEPISSQINMGVSITRLSREVTPASVKTLAAFGDPNGEANACSYFVGPTELRVGDVSLYSQLAMIPSAEIKDGVDAMIGMDALWGGALLVSQGQYTWQLPEPEARFDFSSLVDQMRTKGMLLRALGRTECAER